MSLGSLPCRVVAELAEPAQDRRENPPVRPRLTFHGDVLDGLEKNRLCSERGLLSIDSASTRMVLTNILVHIKLLQLGPNPES